MVDPIRPSAAIEIAYQQRLDRAVDRMSRDVTTTLTRTYRANPPESFVLYGQDASPTATLSAAMRSLSRTWLRKFDELAPQLARYFATAVQDRCDRTLKQQMRNARFTVRLVMTPAMNDAYRAVLAENVALIKSIPAQYMTGVESLVLQSVQNGRDLKHLADGLEKRHGVTKRRAARIARSQNDMATSVLQRTRHLEMGITHGRWLHSAARKDPRPTHVAFSGQKFSLKDGVVLDPKEGKVWPGTAPGCGCVYAPIIEGLDDD